ncbi:MAG: Mrp/NBP35 family ATP-binding protein [Planctomycetes bacterium]|nr:Mrp/NBP35 family ATP-binding protein [Planctomycetota bacterium]
MSVTKEDVLNALRVVEDPDLRRNIVELGFVKHVAVCAPLVKVTIELTTPACPVKDKLREEARRAITALPGITSAEVEMTAQVTSRFSGGAGGFPGIKNAIAVSSGKGGVGKSTTAVNLAVALARTGARVGLLDADVYGPDVPMMLGLRGQPAHDGKRMVPHERYGVKTMSVGYFLASDDNPVVWRGPMIHKFLQQGLGETAWGELDYLIVDMPPGTGDAQLSISQILPLAGAVIVTTPQAVSTLDVRKAISMFKQVEVEILGIVENMSYFLCPDNGKRYDIFGTGGGAMLCERFDLELLAQIPINPAVGRGGDQGEPIVVADPDCEEARAITRAAQRIAAKIAVRNTHALPILE